VATPLTALDWAELQARTLWVHDASGRIVRVNTNVADAPADPAESAAPRFFFVRTAVGCNWRLRADLPDELARELSRLAGAERLATVDALPERMATIRERLEAHAPVVSVWHGPAFRFPERLPPPGPTVRRIGPGELRGLLSFPWLRVGPDRRGPVFGAFDGEQAVAVAHSTTGPGEAVEGGVETLPSHRGRGLAAEVVAAWAAAVRADGRIPLYSTSFGNRASQAVARKLGLIRYGTDLHLR
jgi:GNAT superfamily N-acetyltransferase